MPNTLKKTTENEDIVRKWEEKRVSLGLIFSTFIIHFSISPKYRKQAHF